MSAMVALKISFFHLYSVSIVVSAAMFTMPEHINVILFKSNSSSLLFVLIEETFNPAFNPVKYFIHFLSPLETLILLQQL